MIKYPYSKPHITKSDISEVIKVLKNGYLTQGKKLDQFEKKLLEVFESKNAVVCNSGTAALHLIYDALGLGSDQGLLTTPITFLATANAAKMCGAPVIFADVDPKNGLLTPETVERALIKCKQNKINIKVITVVHLGGKLCDLEGIYKIAKKYNCFLVEDACHAPGAYFSNKKKSKSKVGSCKYSIATTFSFHAIKHVAMGEGGCVLTNNREIAKKIIAKRSHGIIKDKKKLRNKEEKNSPWYYEMQEIGWNYRADEMSCALGLSQIGRLLSGIQKRRILAAYYHNYLYNIKEITLPSDLKNLDNSVWHLYPILIDFDSLTISRKKLMTNLLEYGITTQVHYIPLFMQPYYRIDNFSSFTGALFYYNNTLSLPLYPTLNKKDIAFICSKLKSIITNK